MRSDVDWISDILDAISNTQRYVERGRAVFDADELVRSWMVQQIQIIGEAASRLSPGLIDGSPQVPWRQIIDMRNLLVHGYFHIDPEIVWQVVERDLPKLELELRAIVESRG